jgi:hypothetical protein
MASPSRVTRLAAQAATGTAVLTVTRDVSCIGTVPDTFDHPEHGLVGLHVMFRYL